MPRRYWDKSISTNAFMQYTELASDKQAVITKKYCAQMAEEFQAVAQPGLTRRDIALAYFSWRLYQDA